MLSSAQKIARLVLTANDQGGWTRPTAGLYSHQWLWDSCFIAIGLAQVDPHRAALELTSLARGQWKDGFWPHMIYSPQAKVWETELWHGGDPDLLPEGVKTSTITQPPMLAVATEQVATHLSEPERSKFLSQMVPAILRYHLWLYRDRRPDNSAGLVALVHSWESGMDDSPPWFTVMQKLPHFSVPSLFRRDLRYVKPQERPTSQEEAQLLALAIELRSYKRDSVAMLSHLPVLVADATFNSVLVWNNEALVRLAKLVGLKLPEEFFIAARRNLSGLKSLWDEATGQYYHYDLRRGELIKVPSISTFAPLLTSAPSAAQRDRLVRLLHDSKTFGLDHPVPTVPADSPNFRAQRYWQGPTWFNYNWFIIQGLRRQGLEAEAKRLRRQTLALVETSGCREYFSARTGRGLGGKDFSWTAALYLDLTARVRPSESGRNLDSDT